MAWINLIIACLPLGIRSFHTPSRLSKTHHREIPDQIQQGENDNEHLVEDDVPSFGLYVHIPFCRRRCNYCDFAVVPIGGNAQGNSSGFQTMNQEYTNAVLAELSLIASSTPAKIPLRSIYFGGGTPSLAPLATLREIMYSICKSSDSPFYLEEGAEVTIEMDPGTFHLNSLMAVKDLGFNRISLGVQSLDDAILTSLGRVHRSSDVYCSIEMIQQVYETEEANYSIDLISGVPGLTLAGWAETLSKVLCYNHGLYTSVCMICRWRRVPLSESGMARGAF